VSVVFSTLSSIGGCGRDICGIKGMNQSIPYKILFLGQCVGITMISAKNGNITIEVIA
jgi:hypothetical protein